MSYVKFLNKDEIVTASTDCSLRLWSLLNPNQCISTYTGHTNEKNFVGLSINSTGEFFACGSETNQVFAYNYNIKKPVLNHRFEHNVDPISGKEIQEEDHSHFISSVCWKRRSPEIMIAANSQGRIKVLQMV